MDDVKDLLQRGLGDVVPPTDRLEEVHRDVTRRRGRQRRATTAVALALALAGLAVALAALDSLRPTPADEALDATPLDLDALTPAWSADVPDAPGLFDVVQDAERVYVPTERGVMAFSKSCGDPCEPLWSLDVAGDPDRGVSSSQIAVGEGFVAVASGGHLAVAPIDCETVCAPLWTAQPALRNGYADPLVSNGVVQVIGSEGGGERHHVVSFGFPITCRTDGGECAPIWQGDLGKGPIYSPGTAVGGVFYRQVGKKMTGFAANCASDGGACQPDFVAEGTGVRLESNLVGPVLVSGVLVLAAGDGNVYGYAEHCGTTCVPGWAAPISSILEDAPVPAGDSVAVAIRSRVATVPVQCADPCEPAWTATLSGSWSIADATAEWIVVVRRYDGPPAIAVLPVGCSRRCEPAWMTDVDGKLYGVTTDGAHVFAGVEGAVRAYPLDCSNDCPPVWTSEVEGQSWWLLPDGSHLIVGARTGEWPGYGLALEAFEERPVDTEVEPAE